MTKKELERELQRYFVNTAEIIRLQGRTMSCSIQDELIDAVIKCIINNKITYRDLLK